MTQFLSLLMNGVSLGAIYALIALGFVIIFKASEVVSFTHGSLLLLGAYSIARLSEPLGFFLAALVGIAITALAALLVERLIINRLRGAPVISRHRHDRCPAPGRLVPLPLGHPAKITTHPLTYLRTP